MIEKLTNISQCKSAFTKMYVMKKLLITKLVEGKLQDHFNRFEKHMKELEAVGESKWITLTKLAISFNNATQAFRKCHYIYWNYNESRKVDYRNGEARLLDTELKTKKPTIADASNFLFHLKEYKMNLSKMWYVVNVEV